jgi:hypothetical protein
VTVSGDGLAWPRHASHDAESLTELAGQDVEGFGTRMVRTVP